MHGVLTLALLSAVMFQGPALAAEQKSQSFSNMVVLPTDVRKVSYPYDYVLTSPTTVTVDDPYCAITTDTVAFPADYLGAFPLPAIKGAPLPSHIRRGASVKDYWDFGRTNPPTNAGCSGDIKQAFAATLERLVRLGVDHVNVSQYAFLIDADRPELGLGRPSMTPSDTAFIAEAAASRGLKLRQNMAVAGSDKSTVPPNPVSADWAGRFLDGWSNFVVDQAKVAATHGLEAIQIDFCCFTVDWTPHADLFISRMKTLADRVRQVFPGKIVFGQTNPWISGDAGLMDRIDWLMFDPIISNIVTDTDNANLTVERLKSAYLQNWSALASAFGPARKPVVWRLFAQSHRNYYKPDGGWIEDGFCVDNCMQRSVQTDFSVQAIGYEAWLEAIKEQTFFETASVDPEAYWYVDVMLPKDAFPNISQSWRNKPAESILYKWFSKTAPDANTTVVEYFHPALNHYFLSANPEEIAALDANVATLGWARTGEQFGLRPRDATVDGSNPVCRFYGSVQPGPNSHFYTAFPAECSQLKALQRATPDGEPRWNFEEIALQAIMPTNGACPASEPVAISRLYNNRAAQNDSNHRYVRSASIYTAMQEQGWSGEGVVMCGR